MDPKKHRQKNIIKEYMINLFKLNKLKELEKFMIFSIITLGKNQNYKIRNMESKRISKKYLNAFSVSQEN